MSDKDYYEILEVPRDASDDDIIRNYKVLSKKYHPDKNIDNKEWAEDMFKAINEAKNVLTDPQQRRIYDQMGKEGLKHQNHGGSGNFPFDIFNNMFGSGGHFENMFGRGGNFERMFGNSQGPNRRSFQQKIIEIPLKLEDVYKGYQTTKKLKLETYCNTCLGTGQKEIVNCNLCNGSGVRLTVQQIGPGMIAQQSGTCNGCSGKGKMGRGDNCDNCKGKQTIDKIITIDVKYPPGFRDGMTYQERFENIDFIFIAKVEEHPIFKRKDGGDVLLINKSIKLHNALTGVEFELKTLENKTIIIRSPDNFIIKPNTTYKIKELGLNKADLLINFEIVFPDNLDSFKKELNNINERKDTDKEIFYLSL